MNLEMLKKSDRIIFECIAGSHAYATSNPNSDIDVRGIYINPPFDYLGLDEPVNQIGDEKHDITYYSLKRIFELLKKANPNIIELLWMPEDCVKIQTPIMTELIKNRHLFISKKAYHTHSGYAYAQLKKCMGANKKVHNPQPKEQPKKEDFCWIMPEQYMNIPPICREKNIFPCRPIAFKDLSYDFSRFHVASLEHAQNIYRLYNYRDKAKGVFRGNDMLVCESIPKDHEHSKFAGILIYNKEAYEKAIKDHKSYWDWMKNRNESRWVDQEKGKLNYDQKNVMHTLRLLISSENILVNGEPIVRFKGDSLKYLMEIRAGDLEYEDLMKDVEARMERLKDLYDNTDNIPNSVNMNKINKLYRELSSRKLSHE